MGIEVREYAQGDLPALAEIWNEVVEDGVAFPQEDCLDAESARAFGESVAEKAPTGGNLRGSAAYRSHLIRVLTARAALELGGI